MADDGANEKCKCLSYGVLGKASAVLMRLSVLPLVDLLSQTKGQSARRSNFFEKIFSYAENEVPQPQPPVAFGLSNVKPEPIILVV